MVRATACIAAGDEVATVAERKNAMMWVLRRIGAAVTDISIAGDRYEGEQTEPFNRARARNMAAESPLDEDGEGPPADVLVFVDADTAPELHLLKLAIEYVAEGHYDWVIPFSTYFNMTHAATVRMLATPPDARWTGEPLEGEYEHRITTSASGRVACGVLVLSREAWLATGGYDERFVGWGYEDNAFHCQLQVLGGSGLYMPGQVRHLWHPASHETTFGQPMIEANRRLFRRYQSARTERGMRDLIGGRG